MKEIQNKPSLSPACFIDRDGVLIVEKNYLADPDAVEIIPGAAAALRKLHERGVLTIVISNQSGIARGYFTHAEADKVNARIELLLAEQNAGIDAFYICPHHPDFSGPCDCRKPAPGLFLQAARDFAIDFSRSCMVGDKISDLEAARNAGCAAGYLVLTGYGAEERRKCPPTFAVVPDFQAAAAVFLQEK